VILFPYRLMPGLVARVLRIFESLPTPPVVVQQAIHQETVLGLVAAGFGVSVLPELVQRFQMPRVTTRRFASRPQTELHVARTGGGSPAVDEFILCLRGEIPE
jgi:DNA-binding transcriptional LysR family regulator